MVLQQGKARALMEGPQQVGFVHMQGIGEKLQREFVHVVFPDQVLRRPHQLCLDVFRAARTGTAAAAAAGCDGIA